MKRWLVIVAIVCCSALTYGQIKNVPLVPDSVVLYNSAKTESGINLVDAGGHWFFLTMKGEIQTLPLKLPLHYVNVLADGSFIGCTDSLLIKFDADMNIYWMVPANEIHHEITSDADGNIYLLSSDFHEFMGANVRFDVVKIYSSEGVLIYKWCTYEHLDEFVSVISKSAWLKDLAIPYSECQTATDYILQYPALFFSPGFLSPTKNQQFNQQLLSFAPVEFSHFNSIQVLPENNISKKIPAFKKGNLLVCFNPYSCYGILNPSSGKIEWTSYLPERTTLHTPILTDAGTILIFQNSTGENLWTMETPYGGPPSKPHGIPEQTSQQHPKPELRPWSSITEYDPLTNKKVWEYTATPKELLHNDHLGSAQRLANGNTLICITTPGTGGRIFEVTPEKEIVWDYRYPSGGLYRAKRIGLNNAIKH